MCEYLIQLGLYSDTVIEKFDKYYIKLKELNQNINLFSRKMQPEEIWVRHFADSLSVFEVCHDWSRKRVLDFGTGGGLPGLPLKIAQADIDMSFLDSTTKKIEALRKITEYMQISDVHFLSSRIEELPAEQYQGAFDIIISRAVKITPTIAVSLLRVLKRTGVIYLYKSGNYEDVSAFANHRIHKVGSGVNLCDPEGKATERNIVEIKNG
ncbi:MAG: 16S rRNA (guanine(527)-N(7))-methyltransferase RsmG [Candidatus Cloacimonetes bacterium]|nr:16S rRNA (guanine(527)-N(7))-methyltransferase RsmG [Candidatus Cloacimonadota bacterium]